MACIRLRESGGNYAADTGNGYYGAYQFSESTWRSLGGTGYPNQASPATQDAMAQRLERRSGWGQWSTSSRCGV
jgi:muramidase (phage lysozyme)